MDRFDKKFNEVDYIINTPVHHKQQCLRHINMLKLYQNREEGSKSIFVSANVVEGERGLIEFGLRSTKSEILNNLKGKLDHLSAEEPVQMELLLLEFKKVFHDVSSITTCSYHDVDVGDATPVKQHPY